MSANNEESVVKYCVTPEGKYIGVFIGVDPEVPFVEVGFPPEHAAQIWDFVNSVYLPLADPEVLAYVARWDRDRQLREIYDIGLLMAQRALRTASTQEAIDYAQGKITELDAYASLLQAVPQQTDFPFTITWPTVPTL